MLENGFYSMINMAERYTYCVVIMPPDMSERIKFTGELSFLPDADLGPEVRK